MMDSRKIDESVTVGAQPTEADIQELARNGFQSIINLRPAGEDDQPLDPTQEGEAAQQSRLRYAHIPVSLKTLTPEQVDRFRDEIETLPAPVYIHCKGGTRAAALLALHRAAESGKSEEEALRDAEQIGAPVGTPEYREFFSKYVAQHFEKGD